MQAPAYPKNEWLRQLSVDELNLTEYRKEEAFERVARLAATVAGTGAAAFTVVDRDTLHYKAALSYDPADVPRRISFCAHTILGTQPLIVADTLADQRFDDNPLVACKSGIRFYAGIPVRSPTGLNVGALCVFDTRPLSLSEGQHRHLGDLTAILESELLVRSYNLRDPVTGLYSPDAFRQIADRAWRRARNADVASSMILVSLGVNGEVALRPGRRADDPLLFQAGQCISRACSETEHIAARNRADSFSVLVVNKDRDSILCLAKSIRADLAQHCAKLRTGPDWRVRIGATTPALYPKEERSLTDLLRRAHSALDQAQRDDANPVVLM